MRADRILSILMSLQVEQRVTARHLATRLEVSERTIHRDMDVLSSLGVPVYAERGVDGGWSLLEEYRTTLNGLHLDEIQALFVAAPGTLLADLGLKQAADGALLKLLAGLPAQTRRDAEFTRQRIHIDAAGWQATPEATPTLCTLQEALWQERQVELHYQRDDGVVVRQVDPLGLVAKGRIWYLVAAVAGELRTYRVGRIQSATIAAQPARRPPHFDLAAHWEQSKIDFKAGLPRYPVTLRVLAEIAPRLQGLRFAKLERLDPPDAAGWSLAAILFEVEEDALQQILGFGGQVEVVEPVSLRQQVIEQIEAAIRLYRPL